MPLLSPSITSKAAPSATKPKTAPQATAWTLLFVSLVLVCLLVAGVAAWQWQTARTRSLTSLTAAANPARVSASTASEPLATKAQTKVKARPRDESQPPAASLRTRDGSSDPPPSYYAAWAPVTKPRAAVLNQSIMMAARSSPTNTQVYVSPTFCYLPGGLTCGCSPDTPANTHKNDFNCDNVVKDVNTNSGLFRSDAQNRMCAYRTMKTDGTPVIGQFVQAGTYYNPCIGVGLQETDGGGGSCGCRGSNCNTKQLTCTLGGWNPSNMPACCAGIVDTFYATQPLDLGVPQIALQCSPDWYVGSAACDAAFSQSCMGPTNNSAEAPHAFFSNSEAFPCKDYYGVVRAWMQMGQGSVAATAAAIAAEAQRFCSAEGAATPACAGVASDWNL
jgi:hypothetical protein